jgi:hypothetical protein
MWGTKGLPTYGLGALPVVESINQTEDGDSSLLQNVGAHQPNCIGPFGFECFWKGDIRMQDQVTI